DVARRLRSGLAVDEEAHEDARAGLGEAERDGAPDPAPASRDQDLALRAHGAAPRAASSSGDRWSSRASAPSRAALAAASVPGCAASSAYSSVAVATRRASPSAVDEDEAHARAPSGPRGEARAGGELADDVVAHRAHGEPAHHRLDRGGRVEALSEIAGEAVYGQARQIERGAVEIGEHPHGERPHDLPLVAVSAADAVLGGKMLEDGADGCGRHGPQLLGSHGDAVSRVDHLRQHAQVSPLDPTVLDEPHRQVDAERLLALE